MVLNNSYNQYTPLVYYPTGLCKRHDVSIILPPFNPIDAGQPEATTPKVKKPKKEHNPNVITTVQKKKALATLCMRYNNMLVYEFSTAYIPDFIYCNLARTQNIRVLPPTHRTAQKSSEVIDLKTTLEQSIRLLTLTYSHNEAREDLIIHKVYAALRKGMIDYLPIWENNPATVEITQEATSEIIDIISSIRWDDKLVTDNTVFIPLVATLAHGLKIQEHVTSSPAEQNALFKLKLAPLIQKTHAYLYSLKALVKQDNDFLSSYIKQKGIQFGDEGGKEERLHILDSLTEDIEKVFGTITYTPIERKVSVVYSQGYSYHYESYSKEEAIIRSKLPDQSKQIRCNRIQILRPTQAT